MSELEMNAALRDRADGGEAKLQVRREPFFFKGIAGFVQFFENIFPVALDEVREHEAVMQGSSPEDQRTLIGVFPEVCNQCPHQQLLCETHARVRRHLESPQLHETEARGSGFGWRS